MISYKVYFPIYIMERSNYAKKISKQSKEILKECNLLDGFEGHYDAAVEQLADQVPVGIAEYQNQKLLESVAYVEVQLVLIAALLTEHQDRDLYCLVETTLGLRVAPYPEQHGINTLFSNINKINLKIQKTNFKVNQYFAF